MPSLLLWGRASQNASLTGLGFRVLAEGYFGACSQNYGPVWVQIIGGVGLTALIFGVTKMELDFGWWPHHAQLGDVRESVCKGATCPAERFSNGLYKGRSTKLPLHPAHLHLYLESPHQG